MILNTTTGDNTTITTTNGTHVWTTDHWNVTYNYEPNAILCLLNQIIEKEKIKIQSIDLEKVNKLLRGTIEDIKIAVELLKKDTKYLWRIVQEIKVNGTNPESTQLAYILQDYVNNNIYNLNLGQEIL